MKEEKNLRSSPKDLFLNLAALIALYVSVGAIITLVLSAIDKLFPVAVVAVYNRAPYNFNMYGDLVRSAVATLIIVFPAYLIFVWLSERDIAKNPEKRVLAVRRWFEYLTIFLSVGTIIAGLVSVVTHLLSWDFSLNLVLKIIVVLVVVGGVLFYYMNDVMSQGEYAVSFKRFALISSIIVLLAIVVGFISLKAAQNQLKNPRGIQSVNQQLLNQQLQNQQNSQRPPIVAPIQNPTVLDVSTSSTPVTNTAPKAKSSSTATKKAK